MAAQEGITFAEACAKVKEMGYEGTDISVPTSEEDLAIIKEAGLETPCGITWLYFTDGEMTEQMEQALSFISDKGLEKVLLIPGFMTEEFSEEDWNVMIGRIRTFTLKAAEAGCEVLLEDFDNLSSPCSNIERLGRIFDAVPEIGHVFDSGNYLFSGEDALEALDKFLPRIKHVHLKDRVATENMACPAVGEGCIPIREAVQTLKTNGYNGWLTVEFYGSRHMLEDAEKSITNLKQYTTN